MTRRQRMKRRQKRERRICLMRIHKKERVQNQKRIDSEYKKTQLQKQTPIDLGHKKEILVTHLINALACYSCYPWLTGARQSDKIEDSEGKDVIVRTTQGEFYLQIKSRLKAAEDFTEGGHSEHYKTMYLVAHHDKEKIRCYVMPLANKDAYSFIVIVVVYRKINVTEEIEDIDLVLKKVEIAMDIIRQYVDEMRQAAEKKE